MKAAVTVLNLSDLSTKRRLLQKIQMLSGLYEVSIKPRKLTRSLNANAYYFVAAATPFRDWLREQYGDDRITTEQAHEMLKVKILGLDEKLVEGTSEVLRLIPRSKTLDRSEFADYVDKCAAWLAEFCGIVVLPPELFFERREEKRPALKAQLKESIQMVRRRKA